jgi:putative transposase
MQSILGPWPVERPLDWTNRVNVPLSAKELRQLRVNIARGRRFGEQEWVNRTASELRLERTVRPKADRRSRETSRAPASSPPDLRPPVG